MRNFIGKLGHRIADFDTQSGITGSIMRFCWKIGYPLPPKGGTYD